MTIPVLGTAVVNAPHWVYRLFYSIDYPVDTFVVFNNNGRNQITEELDLLPKLPHKYVKNVVVCHMPANIGCSGAWNLIIKCFMNAPYWIITNHDLMYTPGFLKTMVSHAEDSNTGIVHGENGSWDIFLLKDWVVQQYGLFDENLYPAYCEDMDYADGSQTWRSEPALAEKIHIAHEMNKHYLHAKWSPAWQAHIEGEVYPHPFNNEALPVSLTTYNLEFVRAKNLGF
jgi:hypothetical protein